MYHDVYLHVRAITFNYGILLRLGDEIAQEFIPIISRARNMAAIGRSHIVKTLHSKEQN